MCAITRYEKSRDHDGRVTAIFLAVNACDGEGKVIGYQEHWLTAYEMTAVLADETKLAAIAEDQAAIARIRYEDAQATAPQPTIVADPAMITRVTLSEPVIATDVKADDLAQGGDAA